VVVNSENTATDYTVILLVSIISLAGLTLIITTIVYSIYDKRNNQPMKSPRILQSKTGDEKTEHERLLKLSVSEYERGEDHSTIIFPWIAELVEIGKNKLTISHDMSTITLDAEDIDSTCFIDIKPDRARPLYLHSQQKKVQLPWTALPLSISSESGLTTVRLEFAQRGEY
jgi:hypothetical protein